MASSDCRRSDAAPALAQTTDHYVQEFNRGAQHPETSTASARSPALDHVNGEWEENHAFVQALPPVVDHFTYLTIIEYNLDRKSLPLLHKILRYDHNLTSNVGWDLVHLLLPLLPESKPCLDVVAALGNPREVVIKVNEMLEILGHDAAAADAETASEAASSDGSEPSISLATPGGALNMDLNFYSTNNAIDVSDNDNDVVAASASTVASRVVGSSSAALDRDGIRMAEALQGLVPFEASYATELDVRKRATQPGAPIPDSFLLQDMERRRDFRQLLSMIAVLHPRIKTKRPSRFMATTVESVLCAYKSISKHVLGDATDAVLDLLRDLASVIRPPLPPRTNSQGVEARTGDVTTVTIAADPEAESIGAGEASLQQAVLVSFATRIFEILIVESRQSVPPDTASWTASYMDRHHPGRLPHRRQAAAQPGRNVLAELQGYESRMLTILRNNLGLHHEKTRRLLAVSDQWHCNVSSPDDLPFSEAGALFLLAALEYQRHESDLGPSHFSRIDHQGIVEQYLGGNDNFDLSPRSLAVIDAIVLLGFLWQEKASVFVAASTSKDPNSASLADPKEAYNRYLQQMSFVAANAPSPVLRYQVHHLVTSIIRGTRQSSLRLGYIQDTLEFCPFENLRVTAVGWFKDEIVTACGPRFEAQEEDGDDDGLFGRPETMDSVGAIIFEPPGSPARTEAQADEDDGWEAEILVKIPFWLAVLNLLYLLCINDRLRRNLEVGRMIKAHRVDTLFVAELEAISNTLESRREGGGLDEIGTEDALLLSHALMTARDALEKVDAS